MKLSHTSAASLAALMLSSLLLPSCSEPSFKIKGEIYGAEDKSLVLEKSDFHGNWVAIDSTRTSSNGSFSISRPAPAAPEIFRLSLGDRFVYFPVDSTETLTLSSSLDDFGAKYSLTGSENAENMSRFDMEVTSLPKDISVDSLDSFKRNVYMRYLRDAQGSVVSYYVLTKVIDGKPLFNPADDYKYFAAVATGFRQMRPDDPRTGLLESTTMEQLKRRNADAGNRLVVEAEEVKVLEIDLPDEDGTNRRLSDMVGKGKAVVVMFTLLTHPDSPALNIELKRLHDRYAGSVDFYQVGIDGDLYTWREAARNLPWTTVFDPDGQYSRYLRTYNVADIPTFFIYNRQGELTDRAENLDQLSRRLSSI